MNYGQFVGNIIKNKPLLKQKTIRYYSTSETVRKQAQKKISEHKPKKKAIKDMTEREFGYYLAGIIEANGSIIESKIIIKIDRIDVSLAYNIKKKIGYGKIKKTKEYKLVIEKIEGIEKVIKMINGKLRQVTSVREIENLVEKEKIKIGIKEVDKEENIKKTYWLAGYSEGKGRFKIIINKERKEVKIKYEIRSKLEEIKKEIKEVFSGSIIKNNEIISINNIYKILKYLDEYSLQSKKYLNYIHIRKTYILIQEKKERTKEGIEKIKGYKKKIEKIEKERSE